VIKRITTEVM